MAEEKNEKEIQINLGNIFSFILRKIWIVIICFVVGAGAGYTVAKLTKTEIYSTDARYVVYYDGGESFYDVVTYQTRVASILGNCIEFVQQNRFANIVANELNTGAEYSSKGYNFTGNDILRSISYSYSTSEKSTITITSKSADAEQAYDILMVVSANFDDYIKEHYGLAGDDTLAFSSLNDIEKAKPVSDRSTMIYTALGAVGATAVCVLIFAIIVITDQRVKGEDDLVEKYGIAVLGSVPNFEDKELVKGGEY